MKNIRYLLYLGVAVVGLTTCKKYPEGPYVSFRTRSSRVEGTWTVEKYLVDGVDSTANKYSSYCLIGFGATAGDLIGHKVHNGCDSSSGNWEFSDHHGALLIHKGKNDSAGPLFLAPIQEWEILKLRNDKMHLRTEFNSRQYDIYFKSYKSL